MNEFMLIFRYEHVPSAAQPTAEEIQAVMQKWQDWMGGIAAQGKFKHTDQLGYEGRTIGADQVVTDGPYAEVKEIIGGYVIVKTDTLDEACELVAGCPILEQGGKVEVRNILPMG